MNENPIELALAGVKLASAPKEPYRAEGSAIIHTATGNPIGFMSPVSPYEKDRIASDAMALKIARLLCEDEAKSDAPDLLDNTGHVRGFGEICDARR